MGGWRLGSILGFEIRIDSSWFVIFFLILWTLTMGVFPENHPALGSATHIWMGAVATVLFFASLIVHELSHALVARTKGIPVEGVTLFVFGGIARTRMESENPEDEFQIAAVGPLSSILLAGLFWGVARLGAQAGLSEAVTGVASYLALINLALAIFNLFPGFPLDGGRIFRAAVWKYTGDIRRATRYAATGGRLFGLFLIVLGFINFFARNIIGGMWLVLIGWFLRTIAQVSYQQLIVRRALEGVRASDAMTPSPQTVRGDVSIQEFVEDFVFRGRHHSYPVVDRDDRPIGIIIMDRVRSIPRDEWHERTVADAMMPAEDGAVVGPDEPMSKVLDRLTSSALRRVLVTQNGHLVGILTQSDVARWLQRAQLLEQE